MPSSSSGDPGSCGSSGWVMVRLPKRGEFHVATSFERVWAGGLRLAVTRRNRMVYSYKLAPERGERTGLIEMISSSVGRGRFTFLLLAAIAAGTLLAGCGGDDDY